MPGGGMARFASLGANVSAWSVEECSLRRRARRRWREQNVLAQDGAIFQGVKEVTGWQLLAQRLFYPVRRLTDGCGVLCLLHAQAAHVLIETADARHGFDGEVCATDSAC